MIEGIWDQESNDDIKDSNETPRLWSPHPIEYEARRVYTRKNFVVFKEILRESCIGVVIEHERNKRYEVSIKMNHLAGIWRQESFFVDVDKSNETFSCNCKGFKFEGFLCQHTIKVLLHVGMEHIPEGYILQRWCKGANSNAKRSVEERCRDEEYKSEALSAFRKAKIFLEYKKIEEAIDPLDDFDIALSRFVELQNELASRKRTRSTIKVAPVIVTEEEAIDVAPTVIEVEAIDAASVAYLDPPISHCKGRPKRPGRMKPTFELIRKQGRTCGYCHTKDTHNIRTCPKCLNDLAKEKKHAEPVEDEAGAEDKN